MKPWIVILVILILAVIDLTIMLWIRNRWEPADSSNQGYFLGTYSPILTWLKYRKLPKMKRRERKKANSTQPNGSMIGIFINAFNRPIQLNIHKIFPQIVIRSIAHIQLKTWVEILAIGLVSLAYAYPLLDFDPNLGLTSGEYQIHVGFMTLFNRWITGEIDFPLWNPIVGYGRSLIADPFLFVFNPFVSLPMTIFGLVNGTKVAVVLNFFIAGLGMWFLARALKFERLTRLWCSLIYMMSGAIPSHLIVGQIQLSFSLCWLPWSIAGLIWVINNRSLMTVALASIAQALFFFTGNLYYQVYALFCLLIISIIFTVDWKKLRLRKELAKRIVCLGLFSLGLITIQFLPMLASRSSIHNIGGFPLDEKDFPGSQLPEYAFLNYVVADLNFSNNPVLEKLPMPQENYRYIGIAPILMLLFLVPAFSHGNRKEIVSFGASFIFLLAWSGLRYTFIKQIYHFLPILYQFRFPGRALSVGALFLILLSGYGLNHLWLILRLKRDRLTHDDPQSTLIPSQYGYSIAYALLILGLVFSLRRVYGENRELIYARWIYKPEINLATDWLLEQDESDLTINATYTISDKVVLDAYKYFIRSPNFIDGWKAAGAPYLIGEHDAIQIQPPYHLNWEWEEFEASDYMLVNQIGKLRIWHTVNNFPYAFLVSIEQLLSSPPIMPPDVTPALSFNREGSDTIVVDLEAKKESLLVVSEAWFKGWKVTVDDQPAIVVSVSNFLAVQISPGHHQVVFDYDPLSFKAGLLISGLTFLIIVSILGLASGCFATKGEEVIDEN